MLLQKIHELMGFPERQVPPIACLRLLIVWAMVL